MSAKTFLVTSLFIALAINGICDDLHSAAREGDLERVKDFLEHSPDILNSLDDYKMTALDWAATRAKWDVVEYLLFRDADVNSVGFDGGTVVHRVCHYDVPEIVTLLHKHGADLTLQNRWGRAAIHVVARRGCVKTASLLIELGVDIEVQTREGWTPLHVANKSGQDEMIQFLVDNGANQQATDVEGKLPADYCIERPKEIELDSNDLLDYVGLYQGEQAAFKVYLKDDKLMIIDFGIDQLYATGKDTFYCVQEPWSVRFFRNEAGKITSIEVDFLRRTVTAPKVNE